MSRGETMILDVGDRVRLMSNPGGAASYVGQTGVITRISNFKGIPLYRRLATIDFNGVPIKSYIYRLRKVGEELTLIIRRKGEQCPSPDSPNSE